MGAACVKIRQGLSFAVVSLALATTGGVSAFAADPGVVATAPSGTGAPAFSATPPPNGGTDSQIAGWIAADSASSPDAPPPRTVHGEVSAGVGTGGYRNVSGVADIPVGQTGDLIIAASSTSGQVRGGRYGGYGSCVDALAFGVSSNGSPASEPGCDRPLWSPTWAPTGPMACNGLNPPAR